MNWAGQGGSGWGLAGAAQQLHCGPNGVLLQGSQCVPDSGTALWDSWLLGTAVMVAARLGVLPGCNFSIIWSELWTRRWCSGTASWKSKVIKECGWHAKVQVEPGPTAQGW